VTIERLPDSMSPWKSEAEDDFDYFVCDSCRDCKESWASWSIVGGAEASLNEVKWGFPDVVRMTDLEILESMLRSPRQLNFNLIHSMSHR
jgi:hypothetical protein